MPNRQAIAKMYFFIRKLIDGFIYSVKIKIIFTYATE